MSTHFLASAGLAHSRFLRQLLESRPLVEPEVRRRFFIYARRHANLSPAAVAFKEALLAYANPPMRGAIQAAQGD